MIEKVNLRQVLTIVGIGLAMCFMFSWFGSTKSETVRDNGSGTIRVGEGLKQASDDQRIIVERVSNAAARVERIESSVTDSQGRIGNAQTRVGNIESLVIEADEIARTDQRILQAIKERAKTGDSSQSK
jgi:hypothetical protein